MDRLKLLGTILLFSANTTMSTAIHTRNVTTAQTTVNTTAHAANVTTAPTTINTTVHTPNVTTAYTTINTTAHTPNITTAHTTVNTTTHSSNATTHTSNTTATTGASTPAPTLPPKPSVPQTGNYTVKKGSEVCIRALMGLQLELTNSSKALGYINVVPGQTVALGICEKSWASLDLKFTDGFIKFVFAQDNHIYYLDNVTAAYNLTSSESWNGIAKNMKLLSTDLGYCVKCKNTPNIQLGNNITLVIADLTLQAFNIKDGQFGKVTTCGYDHNNTGLIVGIIVVVLVVLGIIIYLIWHKRKSSGYQRI
ncbi:hypothetical protein GDO86_010052 [Hymenochirus boettgeri]|uniref:Lysosome-associated membrane glycoprotein 2-like luminal domain-containing protein n=1 Tax=Hymenochirus boettgeri TaxID=247094 RepID=A0A8T2JRT8_9PIPI|nr:hypothetical protein GDO86_010052 [Hymenochirus boettgeri]